ncbi:Cytosolic sulfotransferase 1 [Cardamine amara subsp. amara]|uniref:Sulfotransferase n=1 Tax=Cardamine amara subsp. amara TaxID=228776 RepID=A0ABD1AXL7_CARAN
MDLNDQFPSRIKGDEINEETKSLISSLPSHRFPWARKLCKYQECWYYHNTLPCLLNFQRGFQLQDTDIILASFPKSGTTWLKALGVALLERSKNLSSDDQHPLLSHNPHDIVPFLESDVCSQSSIPTWPSSHHFQGFSPLTCHYIRCKKTSRALLARLCNVCRNVKDILITLWFYACTIHEIELERNLLESMFKSFCSGTICFGRFW